MNKYDEKVIEYSWENANIYEVQPKKLHGTGRKIFDFFTDYILDFTDAMKQLKDRDGFYLVFDEKKAVLIKVSKDLALSHQEIPSTKVLESKKKYFDLNGYRFKFYRKVK